jgi:AbrB family looped-hinge helix DNA binding protein
MKIGKYNKYFDIVGFSGNGYSYFQEVNILLIYKSTILVDDKGRITIPQKIREEMGLIRGSSLILEYLKGGQIMIMEDKRYEIQN